MSIRINQLNYEYNPTPAMDPQLQQMPTEEEVQVYRNDFWSGIVMLTKKLFML